MKCLSPSNPKTPSNIGHAKLVCDVSFNVDPHLLVFLLQIAARTVKVNHALAEDFLFLLCDLQLFLDHYQAVHHGSDGVGSDPLYTLDHSHLFLAQLVIPNRFGSLLPYLEEFSTLLAEGAAADTKFGHLCWNE